ncbi:MAG: DUF4358 domain-containing protein [Clostridia bacterium]
MKKVNLKSIISVFCCFTFLIIFSSCNNSQSTFKKPNCEEAANAVKQSCEFPEMVNFGEKQFLSIYKADTSIVDSFSVLVSSSGATADEIAVIKVKGEKQDEIDKNVNAIEKVLKDRIKDQIDGFTGYVEAEVPKLEKAVVKKYGNYVCLIIAPDYSKAINTLDSQFK